MLESVISWGDACLAHPSKPPTAESQKPGATVDTTLLTLERGSTRKVLQVQALLMSSLLLHLVESTEGDENPSWQPQLGAARNSIYHSLRQPERFHEPKLSASEVEMTEPLDEDSGTNNLHIQLLSENDALQGIMVSDQSQADPTIYPTTYPNSDIYMVGANDGLFELISRISKLQVESTTGSIPSAIALSRAISIWQDLDHWAPQQPDSTVSPPLSIIYDVFVGTLFIWLFSILHPDKISDKRVQDTVSRDLVSLANIDSPSHPALLLLPTFIHGLASTRQEDRDAIEMQFERLKVGSDLEGIDLCSEVVRSSWKAYDCGVENSWNWARLVEMRDI
jgi:hypothetical protein